MDNTDTETGHGSSTTTYKLGCIDTPNCNLYRKEKTSFHVLGQCSAHAEVAFVRLGVPQT